MHLVLSPRDQTDVLAEDAFKIPGFITIHIVHHGSVGLHHGEAMVVATEGQGQLLTLPVVVKELFVLVTNMVDHFFILLRAIRQDFEPLGCHDGAGHQLGACLFLQSVLLVTEEELPLVEAEAQIGLLMLLSIGHEVEPVFDNFSHFHPLSPPVEHFGFQVVVCAIPALPPANGLGEELVGFHDGVVGHVLDLVLSEAFTLHQILQVSDVELGVEDLLSDWSDLINLNHCRLEVSPIFPPVEGFSRPARDHVTEHGFLLSHCGFVSVDLASQVHIVLVKFADIQSMKRVSQVPRRNALFTPVRVVFRRDVVLDHLEGALQAVVIEFVGHGRESMAQGLVPVSPEHHLSEATSLVNHCTPFVELLDLAAREASHLGSAPPFLDRPHYSV